MDAIVTAGGIPQEGEPLYEYTRGLPKSMLEIAGKPMIQWVLDALGGSELVGNVVVIGLSQTNGLTCSKPLYFLPNQPSMFDNLVVGAQKLQQLNPETRFVMAVSSDIPTITPEVVDWTARSASESEHEVYYVVIPRDVMEKRFPGSRRSYTRLKDMEVCGGDLHVFQISVIKSNFDVWQQLFGARKNVFKQAAIIGYGTLLLLMLRRLKLKDALRRVAARLNVSGRVLVSPYAELGMDVDKPFQFDLLNQDLADRLST